jgi:hypothetical protein
MTKMLRSTLLAAAVVAMAGCTGPGLTTGLPTGTTPGGTTPTGTTPTGGGTTTTTPTTTGGATCTTNFAATPDTGSSELGAYAGLKLPNGYNSAYHSEDQVTARITQASGEAGWTQYQCNYADAVRIWHSKTGR